MHLFHEKLTHINTQQHADKHWMPAADYSFAANTQLIPVCLGEMTRAAAYLPIAIIQAGEHHTPALLTSLLPGQNHYINAKGKCAEDFIPTILQTYPFARMVNVDTRQAVLCVEDSEDIIVAPDTPGSKPFFTKDGKPAPEVQQIMQLLEQIHNDRVIGFNACALLNKHGLLVDWPLQVNLGGDNVQKIPGLQRVDNDVLNKLSREAFAELKDHFAMALAYIQLVSVHHLFRLQKLAFEHFKELNAQEEQDEDFLVFNENDRISFNF